MPKVEVDDMMYATYCCIVFFFLISEEVSCPISVIQNPFNNTDWRKGILQLQWPASFLFLCGATAQPGNRPPDC